MKARQSKMRNSFILVLSLLVLCSLMSSWVQIGNSRIFSDVSIACFADGVELGGQETATCLANGFGQSGKFCSRPVSVATQAFPNDEYFYKQWALTKLQGFGIWQTVAREQDILIAVLDTGIDQNHEDLSDKVVTNVNFSHSPTSFDLQGHGTHIAGIIAATTGNEIGIAGVAPNSCLLNLKVVDDSCLVDPLSIAKAIVWAVDNGANVINMSFTLSEPVREVEDAVNYAWNKGTIIVTASSNYLSGTPVYPACYSNCIAVAATESDSPVIAQTYGGYWEDVVAPGINIYSTLPANNYGYKSGTSMAAAYVTGVAGLLFSVVDDANDNGLLNDDVRHMIENGCDEIGILSTGKSQSGEVISKTTTTQAITELHTGELHQWITRYGISY